MIHMEWRQAHGNPIINDQAGPVPNKSRGWRHLKIFLFSVLSLLKVFGPKTSIAVWHKPMGFFMPTSNKVHSIKD